MPSQLCMAQTPAMITFAFLPPVPLFHKTRPTLNFRCQRPLLHRTILPSHSPSRQQPRNPIASSSVPPLPAPPATMHSDPAAPGPTYLYFSYGSNMSREKLRNRGSPDTSPIQHDEVWVARAKDWQLCFDLRGAPPTEPAMGSIHPAPGDEVYGLVYRLRSAQCWQKLLASEGVTDTPDRDSYHVIDVDVECYLADNPDEKLAMTAKTLITNPANRLTRVLQKDVRPSQRYMNLLIDGATSEKLPKAYVDRLRNIKVARKWGPSLLATMMNFVIPLMFLAKWLKLKSVTMPLTTMGVFLYAKHEELVTDGKPDRGQKARLFGLKFAMFLVYGVYTVPAALLFVFSPRARMFNKRLRAAMGTGAKAAGAPSAADAAAEATETARSTA